MTKSLVSQIQAFGEVRTSTVALRIRTREKIISDLTRAAPDLCATRVFHSSTRRKKANASCFRRESALLSTEPGIRHGSACSKRGLERRDRGDGVAGSVEGQIHRALMISLNFSSSSRARLLESGRSPRAGMQLHDLVWGRMVANA